MQLIYQNWIITNLSALKAVTIKIGTNAYIYTDKISVLMILIFIHHLLLDQISCLHMHLQYSKSVETRVKDFF